MANDLGWELYRTFLAVLEEGSLSGAARALGITQPTVGRHISALEEAFGQSLFTRSQTGLLPTDVALSLRGHAEAMHSTAAALERAATSRGAGITGTVRVSASEVISIEVLPAILSPLIQKHPGLKVELVSTNRVQDLLQREADIAVRMGPPKQEALVVKRVGDVELGLHAREEYLASRGTPKQIAELSQHTLIGFDEETPFLRAAQRAFPIWRRDAFSLRSNSDVGQLALIRAGCGIGICQVKLARREPRLTRVLPKAFAFKLETWVTMHEGLRGSPRCKAVFDALVKGLQVYARVPSSAQ